MSLQKGTMRYQNIETKQVKYFTSQPDTSNWMKVGTSGSKNWRWITNGTNEIYLPPSNNIPDGYYTGRLKN